MIITAEAEKWSAACIKEAESRPHKRLKKEVIYGKSNHHGSR